MKEVLVSAEVLVWFWLSKCKWRKHRAEVSAFWDVMWEAVMIICKHGRLFYQFMFRFLTKLEIPYKENMSVASLLWLRVNGSRIDFGLVGQIGLEESKNVIRTKGCSLSWEMLWMCGISHLTGQGFPLCAPSAFLSFPHAVVSWAGERSHVLELNHKDFAWFPSAHRTYQGIVWQSELYLLLVSSPL